LAIVTSSVLGLLIGVMRLSRNWLVKNVSLAYIEAIRNTPQLVQLFFIYVALVQLPRPRESIAFAGGALLNNRGVYVPALVVSDALWPLPWLAVVAAVAIPFVWHRRIGKRRVGVWALLLLPTAVALFAAAVEHVDFPELKGFNIVGGIVVPPEFVALWLGLSIYAAAFIAEIVRGSIEAVPKGQNEAAQSLGLPYVPRLFLVTLPQALRIMVPPLISQYLNVIKSSSFGAFIAVPELVQMILGTVLQQSGREIETLIIVGHFSLDQLGHLGLHELVQPARRAGGALSADGDQRRNHAATRGTTAGRRHRRGALRERRHTDPDVVAAESLQLARPHVAHAGRRRGVRASAAAALSLGDRRRHHRR